jgi:hypothetical protein
MKSPTPQLYVRDSACFAACSDGAALEILDMELDGKPFTPADFLARFGHHPINLETASE